MVMPVLLVIFWSLWLLWLVRPPRAGAPGRTHPSQFGASLPTAARIESGNPKGLAWTALDDRQVARFLSSAPRDTDQ